MREEKVIAVPKKVKNLTEDELGLERLVMTREDKLSRNLEEHNHRMKFTQKDLFPPSMPPYFTDDAYKQYLKNKPVQKIPSLGVPQSENFLRYRIGQNIQIPRRIDLLTVKVLWSKEQEQAEEEQKI